MLVTGASTVAVAVTGVKALDDDRESKGAVARRVTLLRPAGAATPLTVVESVGAPLFAASVAIAVLLDETWTTRPGIAALLASTTVADSVHRGARPAASRSTAATGRSWPAPAP